MKHSKDLDLMVELIELCQNIVSELRQELAYFRASVYKNEAATRIRERMDSLRLMCEMLGSDSLLEGFRDYDAELKNAHKNIYPGECSFSARVTRLITTLEPELNQILKNSANNAQIREQAPSLFRERLNHNKNRILANCQPGSRSWHFFQLV